MFSWMSSTDGKATITIPSNSSAVALDSGRITDLVWASIPTSSCLACTRVRTRRRRSFTHSWAIWKVWFGLFFRETELWLEGRDFNEMSPSWGSPVTDNRGVTWESFLASLSLLICNVEYSPTFSRERRAYVTYWCDAGQSDGWSWRLACTGRVLEQWPPLYIFRGVWPHKIFTYPSFSTSSSMVSQETWETGG